MVTPDQVRPSSEIGKADLEGSVIGECYGVGGRGEAGIRRNSLFLRQCRSMPVSIARRSTAIK